jgi:hypothetical protein
MCAVNPFALPAPEDCDDDEFLERIYIQPNYLWWNFEEDPRV